ncbi:MAG: hypothetical protein ACREEY_08550 [Brevundimonas sp.]
MSDYAVARATATDAAASAGRAGQGSWAVGRDYEAGPAAVAPDQPSALAMAAGDVGYYARKWGVADAAPIAAGAVMLLLAIWLASRLRQFSLRR